MIRKIAFGLFATVVAAVSAPAQNYYEIRNLGVLSGQTSSTALDINNNGVVVGRSGNRAFVYQDCMLGDIGTLGGSTASAEAISKDGTIVGVSTRSDGKKRAFMRQSGIMFDLGGASNFEESAFAISSWNLPVGIESVSGLAATAVWYFNNRTIALPQILVNPPSGFANVQHVTDVNDSLQVTGFLDNPQIGVVSAPGFGQWTRIQGIPGFGSAVKPLAINNNGHIVGAAGGLAPHAFLSTDPNQPAKDLGTLGDPTRVSVATDINVNGWVVGLSESSARSGFHAFLHNGTTMIDLNSRLTNGAGWNLLEAIAINDNGWIAGNGTFNNELRAFLLIPQRFPWGPISLCPPIFTLR